MDFFTLANSAHETTRVLLRFLTEETQDNTVHSAEVGSTAQDDDFAHLENIGGRSGTPVDATAGYDAMMSTRYDGGTGAENRPLLSPTAEAALLELSTNFLLYAAMVIITIMVTKIYFPSWLEPREEPINEMRHSYLNVMDDAYKSDLSDEEGGDEEGGNGGNDDDESTTGSEGEGLLDDSEGVQRSNSSEINRKYSNSSSIPLEFDQSSHSKQSVYTNLAICAVMLNLTFVSWGILQERMLTRRYPRHSGEYFTYSYALVFTNRFWTLIMSGLLLIYLKPRTSRTTVIYEYSFPSISNMLSSWCQYEALRYVSFPAVTLFKSFKLAPVMLMGKLLGNQSYPQYDYVVAIFIGIGIAMFMSSTDELTFDFDVYGEESSAKWTGVMLLLFFLFFDSFTSQVCQLLTFLLTS
mmetsp:Transcript_18085/g.37486  ORF Transcript_18085/g.37486 Transcript_18085/m.37486 type:complete len:410 (+) Transcript_18085:332-1561(+)